MTRSPGYDLATGLGSMDVNALVNNWQAASSGSNSLVTLEVEEWTKRDGDSRNADRVPRKSKLQWYGILCDGSDGNGCSFRFFVKRSDGCGWIGIAYSVYFGKYCRHLQPVGSRRQLHSYGAV